MTDISVRHPQEKVYGQTALSITCEQPTRQLVQRTCGLILSNMIVLLTPTYALLCRLDIEDTHGSLHPL